MKTMAQGNFMPEQDEKIPALEELKSSFKDTAEIGDDERIRMNTSGEATLKPENVENFITTGETLLNMKTEKLPYLIEGLFPQTGMIALAGSSDTGKSTFLRQLATMVVCNAEDFLGFKINARYNNVIYVSTEDDKQALSFLLNKQLGNEMIPEKLRQLRFIFESDDILIKLDKALKHQRADCVIIDIFTDLYGGDLNASNKVRTFLTDFHNLSQKYGCLFIFLHHTGKRTEMHPPSKDNLLGSQGFEAKMRLVMELRKDYRDPSKRHLCIVKGNYIEEKDKGDSYVLSFDEKMRYSILNERVPFHLLVKPDVKTDSNGQAKAKAIELKAQGLSVSKIKVAMDGQGFKIGRSTLGAWLKNHPSVQEPLEDEDGRQEEL
jgi:archaellum biogenesis ATPase FlaH